jgi:hypothetical protein
MRYTNFFEVDGPIFKLCEKLVKPADILMKKFDGKHPFRAGFALGAPLAAITFYGITTVLSMALYANNPQPIQMIMKTISDYKTHLAAGGVSVSVGSLTGYLNSKFESL